MVIGWKKEELKSLRNQFVTKAKACEDPKERTDLIETIGMIDDLLIQIEPPKNCLIPFGKDPFKEVMKYDLQFIRDFNLFIPYIKNFADKEYINSEDAYIGRIHESSYALLNTISAFYNNTSAEIANSYNSLIDGNNLRLRILEGKNKEIGCTYPIQGTKIVYMYVSRNNSLQDHLTLAHEMAHGFMYYMNPRTMSGMDRFIYIETIPMFMEMLANDFVSTTKGCQEDGHNINLLTYNGYLHTARITCAMMDAFRFLPGRYLMNKKKVSRFLKEMAHCDDEDVTLLLHDCISEMFEYINSYLAAVELYMVSLEDKEKAFDLVKKITMAEASDPRKFLEYLNSIGIYPGANLDKYAQMLREKNDLKLTK